MDFEEFLTVSTLPPLIAGKTICLKALGKIDALWQLDLKTKDEYSSFAPPAFVHNGKTIE